MTLDDINQQLADLATCGDAEFTQAAQYVQQLVQQVQAQLTLTCSHTLLSICGSGLHDGKDRT